MQSLKLCYFELCCFLYKDRRTENGSPYTSLDVFKFYNVRGGGGRQQKCTQIKVELYWTKLIGCIHPLCSTAYLRQNARLCGKKSVGSNSVLLLPTHLTTDARTSPIITDSSSDSGLLTTTTWTN